MEKCFDWIDRDLLLFKLISYNIDGYFYNAIKRLYSNTSSCVMLNGKVSDFFNVSSGVRQGDVLSPTLFSIMINDLAIEINNLKLGINCGLVQISLLLYADDIVFMADSPEKLQKMLDHLHS